MNKKLLLLAVVLLIFAAGVGPCETPVTPTHREFILVGTDASSAQGQGNILLYGFNSSSSPIFESVPTVVANFTGGIVQGLDIFDYEGWGHEGDGDLDFIALVRSETGNGTNVWEYELFLFENIDDDHFNRIPIAHMLPQVTGAGDAALADCTAADFDYGSDNKVDFIVAIGSAMATVIYKFRNTGTINTPFTQLATTITEGWADHARRMDSADFNRDGLGDFATFDYPGSGDFNDDVVIYEHGFNSFDGANAFPTFYFVTRNTPHSIHTVTAGQFNDDNLPDVIVGGDDDGDPGQYWLYQNDAGNVTGLPVEVFDLNSVGESGQSSGGGVADAYDFNGDGMMDVVATAGDMVGGNVLAGNTTIWYIQRAAPGDFCVSDPGIGLPSPPSSVIDVMSTVEYGNAWSMAAPMTTRLGVGS